MGTGDVVAELERRLLKPTSKAGRTQRVVLRQLATHAGCRPGRPTARTAPSAFENVKLPSVTVSHRHSKTKEGEGE
jgi:hypothetical protein